MKHKFLFVALTVLGAALLATFIFGATGVNAKPQAKPHAQATAAPTEAMNEESEAAGEAGEYCTDKGGTVTERYATYNTNAPEAQWLRLAGERDFCTFLAPADADGFQSQISIDLDTLYAEGPTLAMLAYLEPVALPPFTGANPSTLYCSKLGGTDIWGGQNNVAGGGWVTEAADSATNFQIVGMCMFPDGSMIDSWGLTYKANDVVRGTDLSKVARWQPTTLPNVFVGGTSKNAPPASAVDQTLTQADNKKAVTLKVGDTLTVELPSNATTGYSWQVSGIDDKVLTQVGDAQYTLGSKTPLPGAGGTQTFTFNGVGKGKTTLMLIYVRPWEKTVTPTPNDVWTADVTVE